MPDMTDKDFWAIKVMERIANAKIAVRVALEDRDAQEQGRQQAQIRLDDARAEEYSARFALDKLIEGMAQ